MRLNYPALLSFFTGFSSLSLEILWVRLYGFAMMSTPKAFGFVLMAYLTGVAMGAWFGGKACRQVNDDDTLWWRSIAAIALSACFAILIPALFVWAQGQWWRNPLIDLVLIGSVSGALAYVFPIAHHLGTDHRAKKQGRHFATVYTSNVIGAALGPLVTGYILLDYFTVQQTFVIIAAIQVLMVGFFLWSRLRGALRSLAPAGSLAVAFALLLISRMSDPHALLQSVNANLQAASRVIENKHGVVTIFPADGVKYREGDDAIHGGNVYDGRTNLSIEANTNGLHRLLLLPVLQPEPRRVLMVGLSIGSWLAVVNGFPNVEQVDVIEINPGYLDAAALYPAQWNAIHDPRVNLIIDDARRWLRLHPENRYDLIVMNTTYHWRVNASFLLSREFLSIVRSHMEDGAVMAFNATGSNDAFFTATHVFPHAYRYENFVYAAEFDFRSRKDDQISRSIWDQLTIDGYLLFQHNRELMSKYLDRRFIPIERVEQWSDRPLEVITDHNAITEFKYGASLKQMY